MRIGLISDTHVSNPKEALPREITETFKEHEVQLILHMGDIYSPHVLDTLQEVAPVLAVGGYPDPIGKDPRLAYPTRVVEVGGKKIGMVHDIGWPGPRIAADLTLAFPEEPMPDVLRLKFGQPVDIVAFGDTHEELIAVHQGIWFMNPGSSSFPGVRHPVGDLGTIGILNIYTSGNIDAHIVKLERYLPKPPL